MRTTWVAVTVSCGLGACGDDQNVSSLSETDSAQPDTSEPGDVTTGDGDSADDSADSADSSPETIITPPARAAGARAPLSARCDDSDPRRCFLPWPSSVYLTRAATLPTGVTLALASDVFPPDEGVEKLAGADGFSRVSPIVALLPLGAPTDGVVLRVFIAEPGAAFAREVAIDSTIVPGRNANDPASVVGYPLAPLQAASEHLVIVEGPGLGGYDDGAVTARAAQVALGQIAPASQAEANRFAYFAPAREVVAARASSPGFAGLAPIDPARVFALWDFITRSADDARGPLRALASDVKAQVDDGSARITITSAVPRDRPLAIVVEGLISGLVDRTTGAPEPIVYDVPFRVAVPAGSGDYHIVMYGHGTGGDVHDTSFDDLITRSGAAKVNTEIDGWSGDTVTGALSALLVPIAGTRDLTYRMRRSIAGIAAIQRAVLGPLGELLAAPTILDIANPAAGRRPSSDIPIWAGGSLGGVIGSVYSHLEPTIAGGILNVPGAAFTHWLARSSIGDLLDIALAKRYPARVDQQVAASMAQTIWDEVDGAIWAGARDPAPIFVLQMSVGDPIMPNNGTAMVATALDALMLVPDGAEPLLPVVGLTSASEAIGRTALTEFVTHETENAQIHGFAARDAPAGLAARAQIEAFIATLWAGAPRITIPDACESLPVPGLCDFSETAP